MDTVSSRLPSGGYVPQRGSQSLRSFVLLDYISYSFQLLNLRDFARSRKFDAKQMQKEMSILP